MAENNRFVAEERTRSNLNVRQVLWRLVNELTLLKRLLPLTLVVILLASAAPSFFRWYTGKISEPGSRVVGFEVTVTGLLVVGLGAALLRVAAWASFEISGIWSSRRIHADMVAGLAGTRTTFFDENPSGRLINRLVRDFDELRFGSIIFLGDTLHASTELLGVVVLSCLVTPWAALPALPLVAALIALQYRRAPAVERARSVSATATSRVLDRQNDLIEGREIFVLYGKERRLLDRLMSGFRERVCAVARTARLESGFTLGIRLATELFSFVVLLFVCRAISRGTLDLAMAGVVISALFGIAGSIQWLDFATTMVARGSSHARRVFEYADLPKEEDEERETESRPVIIPAASVRINGAIEFQDYSMSYRKDTPVILHGLDLRIEEGEKVALIGRTGSGKTSLIQSLMRMVHVRRGDIRIGGISIFERELGELRRAFGVVPQSPYLFAGTVRENLDRCGEIEDSRLRVALDDAGLDYSLSFTVEEGGQNLSLGQRQLLCLARVIAADRPIIVLDEPTSGLDPETDARMSRLLKTALAKRTLITIAHRRESLGHYDRIIEMGDGRVLRQGAPERLDSAGLFCARLTST